MKKLSPIRLALSLVLAALAPACASTVEAASDCDASPRPVEAVTADAAVADAAVAVADDAVDAEAAIPPDVVRTFQVRVPINAQTLHDGRHSDGLDLEWNDLWRYTTFSPRELLFWDSPPPRDGSTCRADCQAQLIARAAQSGGALPATLTTTLGLHDRWTGTRCVRELEETISLDFRDAVQGIGEDLDSSTFLVFHLGDRAYAEVGTVPCAR